MKIIKNGKQTLWFIGAGFVLIIIVIGWHSDLFVDGDIKQVDFNDVITDDKDIRNVKHDKRPLLRIAIASMISPRITKKYYEDLLQIIGNKLNRRVVFLQRKTYAEVNNLLESKEIDCAFVCSGPYISGKDKFGMEILTVPVVCEEKRYYAYIIANKASAVRTFNDLKGKKFAFTDTYSHTGCLVPRYMLVQQGFTPDSFFSETFYTNSHDNSIQAVAEGLADGAAVNCLIWEFLNAEEPEFTRQTKIIAQSPPYGMPPIVVHPDLKPSLKNRLRVIFMTLHQDEGAWKFMQKLHISRFEKGDDALYDTVREMQNQLKKNEAQKNEP
ncbi:phosphate/phosphite/phosphonate ABC transporter substrate-binding protein [Desulfococcaceae bacterium HSG7]|nr:phosphate/phosphite/phosphonate ABC transporter substrate-binding protein [Desulfococcaceae bacterium HSG7]